MASTDPKIATQGQWEDLADRVQSKAEIGSVLSTPSNVAYVDTNNIVDAAVTTSKVADGAVTAEKIDTTTLNGGESFTISESKSVGSSFANYGNPYTIDESGLYSIELSIGGGNAGSTGYRSTGRILVDDNSLFDVARWSAEAWSGNNFTEGNRTSIRWLNKDSVIKVQGKNENWTGTLAVTARFYKIY